MLTSKLQFAYNVTGRVLENNLKSQYSHIKQSITFKSRPKTIYSFIVFRGVSTFKARSSENIRYESFHDEKPQSISYFTARPTYIDIIIQLDELISKYRIAPTKVCDKSESMPPTLWKLKQHLDEELGLRLKANQYHAITRRLNKLNNISPEFAPKLHNFLDLFRRYDLEKEKKRLESMKTIDQYGRAFALGKRKEAVAQVWVVEGDGHVFVNGKPAAEYFPLLKDRVSVFYPFQVTDLLGKYNVWTKVKGGGITGQSEAIAHGITKALIIHNSDLKPILRAAKLVTRDTRVVERKKPGLAKARKRYTWVKR